MFLFSFVPVVVPAFLFVVVNFVGLFVRTGVFAGVKKLCIMQCGILSDM